MRTVITIIEWVEIESIARQICLLKIEVAAKDTIGWMERTKNISWNLKLIVWFTRTEV